MPTFRTENLSVTPKEFICSCNNDERDELVRHISKIYDFSFDEDVRSVGHKKFLNNLTTLKKSWYNISKNDEKSIDDISKKYTI